MNTSIGFVGLGQMGSPIAINLLRAGYHLRIYDKKPDRAADIASHYKNAIQAPCVSAAVETDGLIISMVSDDEALSDIVFGDEGILQHLGQGVHLSLSTISPELSLQLARHYTERQSCFLGANVSGRPDVAASGKLTIYLSGNDSAKKRVQPLLSIIGEYIYDLGTEVESANVTKLAANYLILAALAAMGTASTFVERHNIPREILLRAMRESVLFRGSAVYEEYGNMISTFGYNDGKFPVRLGLKDAELILHEGERVNMHLPACRQAYEALLAARSAGYGDLSWAILAEYIEQAFEDQAIREK